MKICRQCGCEIINGENGCQFMGDICFDCGGRPNYNRNPPMRQCDEMTWDEVDTLEGMCLSINYEY